MLSYNTFLTGGRSTPLTIPTTDNANKYPDTNSILNPYLMTSLLLEIENLLTQSGQVFDGTKTNQLQLAIQSLAGGSATFTPQTSGFTAAFGGSYLCKVGGGGFTVTLPASPGASNDGQSITLIKSDPTLSGNTLTIGRNGENIMGAASDLLLEASDGENIKIILVWDDTASQWVTAV